MKVINTGNTFFFSTHLTIITLLFLFFSYVNAHFIIVGIFSIRNIANYMEKSIYAKLKFNTAKT